MIPQFVADTTFRVNWDNMARGLTIFTIGLFKKVVIADSLAPWVNDIFARADALTFLEAWIGALGYTLQLYFDFSGYSEMAIGLGLMLNLKLPMNFNSPYQSLSVIDFWRRWHMTLGLWVKNYLYIPMGGGRCSVAKKMRNLFLSMLIIGLWHGAGWTFVFWGGLHGVMLMINHLWRRTGIALPKVLCWTMTFLGVVVCWVFFRAENFSDAWHLLTAMTNFGNIVVSSKMQYQALWVLALTIAVALLPNPIYIMNRFRPNPQWLIVTSALGIVSFYHFSHVSDFLYFQF